MKSLVNGSFFALRVLTLASLVGISSVAYADTAVIPNTRATVEGDVDNGFPFGYPGMRYQQVYSGGEFPPFKVVISQISFRPDSFSGGAFDGSFADVQFNLSTTSTGINTLSPNFADNVGPDETVVHSGLLPLSSAFTGPVGGPKAFDIIVNLQVPFLYDPTVGNLLMEVRNYSGGVINQLDADVSGLDGTSRLYALDGVTGEVSGFDDTLGLVTRFTYEIVPEPHSGLLAMLCIMFFWRMPRPFRRAAVK